MQSLASWLVAACAVVAGLGPIAQVQAAPTPYIDRAAFESAAGAPATDSFDDLAVGIEVATPLPRTASPFTYVATAGPASDFLTASDGGTDVWLSTNVGSDSIALQSFTGSPKAIGAYVFATDLAGYPTPIASVTVTATDTNGIEQVTILAPSTSSFVGFTSSAAFKSVTFDLGGRPGAWVTINDVVFGPLPVPEPVSGLLMLIGLGAVVLTLRRRS